MTNVKDETKSLSFQVSVKKFSKDGKWISRAVPRLIVAGSYVYCDHCKGRVKFKAGERHIQVICNVYIDGVWVRVEHYHKGCYIAAGQPYGFPRD